MIQKATDHSNLTQYSGKADQNHRMITASYPLCWPLLKTQKIASDDKDVENLDSFSVADERQDGTIMWKTL